MGMTSCFRSLCHLIFVSYNVHEFMKVGGSPMVEQVLRSHRDQALQLIKENRAQSREGIELLVRGRLGAIAAAIRPAGGTLSEEQLNALYHEVLDLSYMMFSLGYTMAHMVDREAAHR
jgi:hypothetical protein